MRIRINSIEAKLACSFILVAVVGSFGSTYFAWLSIQRQLLFFQVQALTAKETTLPVEEAKNTLIESGVNPTELAQFFQQNRVPALGFFAQKPHPNQAFWVTKKSPNEIAIRASAFDVKEWISKFGVILLLALIGVSFLACALIYVLAYRSLMPLRQLRRTTDDILAGRFEIHPSPGAEGEIKTIYNALEKLCKELEEKHKALGNASVLATVDGLTSIKNHRSLKEALAKLISSLDSRREDFGFLIFDVDHFKYFNDSYGHQQGDEVLRTIGRVLKETAREGDFVARYGGEEFAAILPRVSAESLLEMAEKIRNAIASTNIIRLDMGKDLLKVTISVGGVYVQAGRVSPADPLNTATLIAIADKNMYLAKQRGRNNSITSSWPGK